MKQRHLPRLVQKKVILLINVPGVGRVIQIARRMQRDTVMWLLLWKLLALNEVTQYILVRYAETVTLGITLRRSVIVIRQRRQPDHARVEDTLHTPVQDAAIVTRVILQNPPGIAFRRV